MPAELPAVIARFLAARDRRATDETLATLTPDARVVDDGHEHVGTDAVRGWLDTAAVAFTFTRTLLDATDEGDGHWMVVNRIEGDFPGGQVDLRYRFTIVDGRIAELVIAP